MWNILREGKAPGFRQEAVLTGGRGEVLSAACRGAGGGEEGCALGRGEEGEESLAWNSDVEARGRPAMMRLERIACVPLPHYVQEE